MCDVDVFVKCVKANWKCHEVSA